MRNIGIQIDNDYNVTISVKRDESGLIETGFSIGQTKEQNMAMILLMHKGELKAEPMFGVGIEDMCNDNDAGAWKREITNMLAKDAMKVTKLNITTKAIELEGDYE